MLFDPSAGFLRQPMQVYLLHFVQSTADIGVGCEPLAKGIHALMWHSASPTDKRARHVGYIEVHFVDAFRNFSYACHLLDRMDSMFDSLLTKSVRDFSK
jgi:hypothetical protein